MAITRGEDTCVEATITGKRVSRASRTTRGPHKAASIEVPTIEVPATRNIYISWCSNAGAGGREHGPLAALIHNKDVCAVVAQAIGAAPSTCEGVVGSRAGSRVYRNVPSYCEVAVGSKVSTDIQRRCREFSK